MRPRWAPSVPDPVRRMTTIATTTPAAGPIAGPRPGEEEAPKRDLFAKLGLIWEVLSENLVANLLVIIAIVIGFMQGWLKFRFGYIWLTFIYDIPLILALVITLGGLPRGKPWFPECGVSTGIKILVGCCVVWGLLPFGVPMLVAAASFRGWCFAPLMFLLGYHLCRTVRQVEIFMWVVLIMGLATAVYGVFFQSEAEVIALMKADPEMELKLRGNFYATSTGSQFRRYSTFVSSAVFGVTMGGCVQFATSRIFLPGCSWIERGILLVTAGICSYAVVLSGSRTSLLILILALLLTGTIRTGGLRFLMLPALVFGAMYYGISQTGGAAIERFGSLLDVETVWARVWIVISPSASALADSPLGGGLGRSGHGIPGVFANLFSTFQIRGVDGDIGRLIVDMGVVGFLIYVILLYNGCKDSFRWMWRLKDSKLGVIGVPAGAWFVLSLLQVPTGSPYLAIPFGALTWIFFGALRRMVEEYDKLYATIGADVESLPQFSSFIRPPRLASIFGAKSAAPVPGAGSQPVGKTRKTHQPAPTQAPVLQVGAQVDASGKTERPAKRFLYRNHGRPKV